mmetsp:Transcript_30596/g.72170  ORF Transcript_30596/g.72170 Transcript_30596/m.72170 type:complete len:697 (-) Transcript_30596:205-2295(-)
MNAALPYSDADNGSNTFAIDDDDECVIEDEDDSFDDEEAHRSAISSILAGGNTDPADDYNLHDQLPSVEEVKASNAYLPTALLIAKKLRRKVYLYIAAAAAFAIVVSVSFSVGYTNKSSKNQIQGTDTEAHLKMILEKMSGVSVKPLLVDPHTPQYHAAQFIANGDSKHLDFEGPDGWRTTQRYILAVFYYATGGQTWTDKFNFMSSRDHCEWNMEFSTPNGRFLKGVQCDDNGSVRDIDLSNNNLVAARIPTEIEYLRDVERLHLHGNTIGGHLPRLNVLPKLRSLGLMNLDLVGTIPAALGELTTLTTLGLGKNKFNGPIPESFSRLTNLRILGLDGIGLTGNISPVLKLSNLEALYLEDNNLTGEIYKNEWSKIEELDLSNNVIDGGIPEDILNNQNLHVFDINRNIFFGNFPQKIQPNDNIQYISVHGNSLSGSLSDHVGFMPNLKHLDVAGNQLSGTIPDTIQLLTNLVSLSTSGNKFDAKSLSSINFWDLTKLQDLSLKGNNFRGTIPEDFGLMTNLRMLDLDGNKLTGTISTWFGLMGNLAIMQLNRNHLTGTIPSELSEMANLKILLLDGNSLHGDTKAFCRADNGVQLAHFTTDCYPGTDGSEPEVDCRCCSLCCNDENPNCNNKDWTASYDPKAMYGYIRPAYNFNLDQAPAGWMKTMQDEATMGQHELPSLQAKYPITQISDSSF